MFIPRRAVVLLAIVVSGFFSGIHPAYALLNNGENAVDELGEYNSSAMADNPAIYTKNCVEGGASPFGFNGPGGSVIDATNHWLFISDTNNNRVLVFPLTTGNLISSKTPSWVLGQADFVSCNVNEGGNASQTSLNSPGGLAIDPTNHLLYVADASNDRVMVFPTSSMSNGETASYVIGQASFTANNTSVTQATLQLPTDVALDTTAKLLYVADHDNTRIMVFPSYLGTGWSSPGENATYVLGQSSWLASVSAHTQTGMNYPVGVALDTTNHWLYVGDQGNNRVMVFPTASITSNEPATYELGQPPGTAWTTTATATTQSGFNAPYFVATDTTNNRLFVSDYNNNRIMIFSTPLSASGGTASYVLGATDYVGDDNGDTTYNGFGWPGKPAYDSTNNLLYVPDAVFHRVLEFQVNTTVPAASSPTQDGNDACAIANSGLYCWGSNYAAEDGLGYVGGPVETPYQVSLPNSWTSVSMGNRDGDYSACGLSGGAAYCWGNNQYGELGIGNTTQYATPQQIGTDTTWTAISSGGSDNCGIDSGNLYCWGENNVGEDGVGNTTQYTTPQQVAIPPSTGLLAWWKLDDGSGTSAADSSGNGETGTLSGGTTWATGKINGALTLNGSTGYVNTANFADNLSAFTVSAWFKFTSTPSARGGAIVSKVGTGGVQSGEGWWLGISNSVNSCNANGVVAQIQTNGSAAAVECTNGAYNDGNWHLATMVVTGGNTVTLYIDGAIPSESNNSGGTMAGFTNTSNVRVGNDYDSEFFNGTVDDVRIYNAALTQTQVYQLYAYSVGWSAVSENDTDGCAINTSGALFCWGYNHNGEVGVGNTTKSTSPQQIGNIAFVTSAAVASGSLGGVSGANTTCQNAASAAGLGGTFKAWLSDGTTPPSSSFTQSLAPYKDVLGNIIAYDWGQLVSGKLSHAINTNQTGTTSLSYNVWTNVSTSGGSTTSGSSTTGNCAAWTNATSSDKGNYGSSSSTTSTWTANTNQACNLATAHLYCFQQDGGNVWSSVSQGAQDTCAITTTGKLYCSGSNSMSEFGIGNSTQYETPVQVGTFTNWIAVSVFSDGNSQGDTCGIRGSAGTGSLWCMGANGYGQDGVGNTTAHNTPVQVGTATTWSAVSVGDANGSGDTCGVNNGQLYCWGINSGYEDGLGNTTEYTTPQAVTGIGTILNGEDANDLLGQYTSATSPATVQWYPLWNALSDNEGAYNTANNGPNALGFFEPAAVVMDTVNHQLFVSDICRVLVFNLSGDNSISTSSGGHTADYVIGAQTLQGAENACTTDQNNLGQMTLGFNYAGGMAVDTVNNRLFVADPSDARVLVFSTPITSNGPNAIDVLGTNQYGYNAGGTTQSTFQSGDGGPEGLAYDSANTRLYVADKLNNRVMVFSVPCTGTNPCTGTFDGENAAYVLGQSGWTSSTAAATQTGMNEPMDLAYDSVNKRLFVADNNNNRVLVFNTASLSSNEPAIAVIGQTSWTGHGTGTSATTMITPNGLAYDSNNSRLFVMDSGNNRVLAFNASPNALPTYAATASFELGQTAGTNQFTTSNTGVTQSQIAPYSNTDYGEINGLYYDPGSGRVFVTDMNNNRVLIFEGSAISTNTQQLFIPGYE